MPATETWMGFSRIFDNVWSGRRHAMLGPTQIDKYGQSNTSALGGTYDKPKVMMLGARGFPGNSISHPNSFFVPSHNTRVFMDGECDFVSSIGYNPARLPKGHSLDDIDIRLVVTDLCVMDFGGPEHQIRLVSLHPGITVEQVQENTGYPCISRLRCRPRCAHSRSSWRSLPPWIRTTSGPTRSRTTLPGDRS